MYLDNRNFKGIEGGYIMIANTIEYAQMFGDIVDFAVVMAKCACVACNSCTCGCSCRNIPELDEIEWD